MNDTYKTITKASKASLYKEKGSKFIGYAIPVLNEDEIQHHIKHLKKEHHKARHWCYAWQLGTEQISFRVNDDGEPSNSAGQPIYGQILSKETTNILIVVVRYFGGVKLGVGGLVRAYKTAAQLALESTQIITKTIDNHYELSFEYKDMNKLQRIIKKYKVTITNQELKITCKYFIKIRKSEANHLISVIEELRCIKVRLIEMPLIIIMITKNCLP
jgi:uncharacterized YigZ family protein